MAAQHTQGPVIAGTIPAINNQLLQFHAVGIEATTTAVALTGVVRDERDALSSADARRIAACWNYCEGLDTNGMELAISIARPIKTFIDESIKKELELTAQRDQLLKALQAAVECSMVPKSSAREGGAMAYARQAQVADMIRDAIAACQPQPTVQHLPADDTEGGAA